MMSVNQLPILYSFRRCPYAMRARMALILTQSQVELREVVLKDKPESMLTYSPKGTVPVLVLPDGRVIEESIEIIDWAISQNEDAIASSGIAQKTLIRHNDGEFKAALDKYKYFDRYPEHNQSYYRRQGEIFLAQLEKMLTDSCFLYGDSASYADIAIFPFIRQFSHVDKIWFGQANYPGLRNWLNYFLTSDDFSMVMTKFSPWQQDDAITLFPFNLYNQES